MSAGKDAGMFPARPPAGKSNATRLDLTLLLPAPISPHATLLDSTLLDPTFLDLTLQDLALQDLT